MSTTDRTNKPMTAEDNRKIIRNGVILSICSMIFMSLLFLMVYHDTIRLYPKSMKEETLKGFAARVEYTLRYQTLLLFWLVFFVFATIYVRLTTVSLNPLDDKTEYKVMSMKNILTNSMESIVISVFAQLIFVTYAQPLVILKYIPLLNLYLFIGRLTFLIGYPLKRAFGYLLTIIPNMILMVVNLYYFGSFVELY